MVFMALRYGAIASLNPPVQQDAKLAFAALAVPSGLCRSRILLTARHYRYHPARYMKDPPQVHPRSVRGRRKLALRRPAGSRFIRGRSLHSAAIHRPGKRGLLARAVSPKRYPISAAFSRLPRIPMGHAWARPSTCQSYSRSLTGSSPRTGGQRNRGASGSVKRPLPLLRPERSAQNAPPSRVHDRGRCPLYVRAQLETAGLTGTQRDLAAAKATAREAGYTQLTGRFRR